MWLGEEPVFAWGRRVLRGPEDGVLGLVASEEAVFVLAWGYGPEGIVAPKGSYVVALRLSDGNRMWARDLEKPLGARSMALDAGRLIVAGCTGVFAFDAATGRPAWRTHADWPEDEGPSDIAFDANYIYVSRLSGHLLALDKTNGRKAWERTWTERICGVSLDQRRIVVVVGDGPRIVALGAQEGNTLWEAAAPRYSSLFGPDVPAAVSAAPALDAGRVVVATCEPLRLGTLLAHMPKARAVALSAESGDLLWRADLPRGAKIGIASDGEQVYLTSLLGDVVCLSLRTGKRLWKTTVRHRSYDSVGARAHCEAAIVSGGYLVVPVSSGEVFGLSCASGKLLWRLRFEGDIGMRSCPLVAGEHLIVAHGGNVSALRSRRAERRPAK